MRSTMKLLIGALSLAATLQAQAYDPAATGAWKVVTSTGEWTDAARDRVIPYRIYQPESPSGRCPVIIVSHGLGGTRDAYAYLGRAWAAHGYLVLHLQHKGSDDAAWRDSARPMQSMREAAGDYRNALDRVKDVSFALDRLVGEPALAALVDTNRMGIAGHSFGSWTVLAAAGQQLGPLGDRLADRRLKAGLAMSSPVPRRMNDKTYGSIRMPILHMTGTEDVSPISDTTAAQRRIPFDRIAAPHQYLAVFQGGDHMIFSGRGRRAPDARDARFQSLIVQGSLAFWDAWLRDDADARKWLDEGGYAKALGDAATFERK
jgi:predicted dienelactone hydrolase